MMKINFHRFLILIYLLINFAVILFFKKNDLFYQLNGDSKSYFNIAFQIHQGRGIGDNIWWPPLYHFIVSFFLNFQNSEFFLSIFQTIIFLLTLYCFYLLLNLFVKEKKKIILLIVIFSFIPTHIIISKIPLADSLFLFFYSWHFFFLCLFFQKFNFKNIFLSSSLLILATFTKPTLLYLHFFEFMAIFIYLSLTRKINFTKLFTLFLFLLILPQIFYTFWSYRNFLKTGVFVFANVKNYNLLTHNFFHIYPYIALFDKNFPYEKKWKIGEELIYIKANTLRSYLKNELINEYLKTKVTDPLRLEKNKKIEYEGILGRELIIKYFWIYLPIHYFKSLKLFFPNNWELFRFFFSPKNKILVFISDFILGSFLLTSFLISLLSFIKKLKSKLKNYDYFKIVNFLILVNLFYLSSAIGPIAFDDSGRFAFVFWFFCLLFIGFNYSSLPDSKRTAKFVKSKIS